jgi:L-ascorbate metabolism protein UlaG (beta-lactamase superfamily)
MLREMLADTQRALLPAPAKLQPETWSDHQLTLGWLGHSTVLINFFGIRILTDPVFSARAGINAGVCTLGPKRYVAPALRIRDLPPVDVVLLSHAHYDHMDLPSLKSLRRLGPAFTVTAKATADVLKSARLQPVELGWNERATFQGANGKLEIQAFEVKHWGQRWPSEVPRGYNGYVLRREGKAVIFAGDTALMPAFRELRSRGPYEVAIMPIGAYDPWIHNHCTPEQALQMANAAGARYVVPIHHQTFRLSHEPMAEPIQRLADALEREPERLALREIGGSFVCPS